MSTTMTPEKMPLSPGQCRTMADVRSEIDRLDRMIVPLMAERLRYIARAGEIKPHRDHVRDEWRVEDVVSKVRATAQEAGTSPSFVEEIYRLLIERSIQYEFEVFDSR